MNEDVKQHYKELVALTQLFLLQEFEFKRKIPVQADIYQDFKKRYSTAEKVKEAPLPPPIIVKAPPVAPSIPLAEKPKSMPEPVAKPVNEPPKAKPPEEKKSSAFKLEPFSTVESFDYQEMRETIRTQFPQHTVLDQIPSDKQAQHIKKAWQTEAVIPPIVLLSFNEQEKQLAFLKNVAQAITRHLAPACVLSGLKIEQEKKWDIFLNNPALRFVIASDYGIYLLPGLMHHYKESNQAKHFLKNTPLLLLSDVSLYLKQPQLKPLLWRTICTEFRSCVK